MVLPQSCRLDEGLVANPTNVVPLVEMSLRVHPQLLALHELLRTHRALELFHSSVNSLVVRSFCEETEPFLAEATLVTLFTCVQCLVVVQRVLIFESHPTF